jgi:hypothetical protein
MKGDSRASTIKSVPPWAPSVGADAEAELLIKEARARARRRRRRLAVVLIGSLAVIAGVFAAVRGPSGQAPARRGDVRRPSASAPAVAPGAAPLFFADAQGSGEGNGPLQIRATATGSLVWQEADATSFDDLTGLAAVGQRSFVIARTVGNTCATRLYRVRLSTSGLPGAFAPVGPTLPGLLWSLTVGDDGQVIGYAISGCSKGAPGYLGVLQVSSGRTRQWSGMSLGGVSSGDLALQGQLSMSANGRLLAFAADASSGPYGPVMSQSARVMATDAPPGSVARRSYVVYRHAPASEGAGPSLAAASLSPSGKSVYLCLQSASRTHATAEIAAYGTTSGKPGGMISIFSATGTWPQVSCSSMSLDSSGWFLLVPYGVSHQTPSSRMLLQRVARIDLAARAVSTVRVRLPGSGGISQESGLSIVAW